MGDLFLHLGFARRLRFADGLHPVVVETLVRQPAPVVIAATLPLLPGIEQKSASLLRRLLGRGKAESARWAQKLGVEAAPRGELLVALLKKRPSGPGQMTRLALALGALSYAVLEASTGETTRGLEGAERQAVERGQARLWLQLAVPSLRELAGEWVAATTLDDPDRVSRALEQLDTALREVHGEAPGVDTLARWGRALAAETAPLEQRAALPPEGAMPEHEVRSRYFEGDAAFLEKAQAAIQWFVYLANEVGALCLGAEPSEEALREALCDEGGALRALPEHFDVEAAREAWRARLQALRVEHLTRGRNPKPAYYESYARGEGAPPVPPLPEDASGPAPRSTQEISAADIEAELPTPALTQEISAADIEEEAEEAPGALPLQAPAMTQEISAADIESELDEGAGALRAPTSTQQISAADIEAELDESGAPPAAPTSTQQISAADIEAELSAPETAASPPADGTPPLEAPPAGAGPSSEAAASADAASGEAAAPDQAASSEAAPSSEAASSEAAPSSEVAPSSEEPLPTDTPASSDATASSETAPPEDRPAPHASAGQNGFPAPPHTPPLGTQPADAGAPPSLPSPPAAANDGRRRTPPLGTPISHVNGAHHDGERSSEEEPTTEDSSNPSS